MTIPGLHWLLLLLHAELLLIARPLLDLTKKTTPWHWGE